MPKVYYIYSENSIIIMGLWSAFFGYKQGWGEALSNSLSLKHKHLKFFKHKHMHNRYPGIHDLSTSTFVVLKHGLSTNNI